MVKHPIFMSLSQFYPERLIKGLKPMESEQTQYRRISGRDVTSVFILISTKYANI